MQTKTQHFQVTGFRKTSVFITVDIEHKDYPNKEIPVTINRIDFEKFLDEKGRLEWELNISDVRGEHDQKAGKITVQQYWEDPTLPYVYEDLYDFVISHPILYRGIVRENSVESILNGFKNFVR